MDLTTITAYSDLRDQLHNELSQAANNFIRIGYLLKKARDTNILEGKGYKDVNAFASAEFGLDKTQVSRFIRINDKFSEGGNSDRIQDKYAQYGSAKLSLMLTLPDEINEELSPEFSKSDIQTVKEEYEAEQKISDLEVMMEEQDPDQPDEFIALVVKQLNDEHEEPITFFHNTINLAKKMGIETSVEDVKEAYIPDGDKTYNIRIAGQGRFMISMKEVGITITNMRDTANKSSLQWVEFYAAVIADEKTRDFTVTPEPAKEEKKKSKKVEKAKPKENKYVKEVREYHERENAQKETENAQKDEKTSEIEKVEGEIVEEPAMNPPEEPIKKIEPTAFEKQICNELGSIIKEIMDPDKTNWGHITDRLRDTIRLINNATF